MKDDRKKKLKICQLCAVDFTVKKFLLPLIDAQIKQGHEVTVVCSEGKYTKSLLDAGYNIETLPIERSFNLFKHLQSSIKLHSYLKENSFDVLHVHTPVAAMIGRLAALFTPISLVVYTAHGFYFHEHMGPLKKYFYIFLEYLFGLVTDLLFTQSKEDAESAKQYNIMPAEHVYAIGNGVDKKKFDPNLEYNSKSLKKSLNIPEDSFVVGLICRLVKEKGIEEFLQAAEQVRSNHKNCFFLLIGEKQIHDHAESVDGVIENARKSLGSNLILTGYRSDIPELLNIMDLYVLPSWREGMPRSIIEAMMMGLPVLATDIRGSREEVIHNETGLLVPIKSPDLLAKSINELILNPIKTQQMGKNGRRRALEIYDEEKIIEFQLDIISKYQNRI